MGEEEGLGWELVLEQEQVPELAVAVVQLLVKEQEALVELF